MLIPMDRLYEQYAVRPRGVVHLGAHLGEEAPDYAAAGIERVFWVEANDTLLPGLEANIAPYPLQRAVQAVVSDKDDAEVLFRTASFSMSSSILKMTGHLKYYPTIVETGENPMRSIRVDTLMHRERERPELYDMANVDLEGAELMAMRGMPKLFPYLKWVYSEVYFEELYAGCSLIGDLDIFLASYGFGRVATEDTHLGWGDALYVRPNGTR